MYRFFAKVFGLDLKALSSADGDIDESSITIEHSDAQLVFGTDRVLPPGALKSHDAIMSAFRSFFGG